MVEYYLKDLITQHPGGWQDIIDYVNENYDRYQATYKIVDATVKRVPREYSNSSAKREKGALADLIYNSEERQEELPRLELVKHPIAGIAASMGWSVLKALELPVPGHKDWLKPCSKWR